MIITCPVRVSGTGLFKTKPPAIPKNPNVLGHCSSSCWQAWIEALWNFHKISRAEYVKSCCWKGGCPGEEISDTPDVVDEVDGGDGVEELGVDAWRRVRRVRRVGELYACG
jgi:hypothetical protein